MIRSKPANVVFFLVGVSTIVVSLVGIMNPSNPLDASHPKMVLGYVIVGLGVWIATRAAFNLRRRETSTTPDPQPGFPDSMARINLLAVLVLGGSFFLLRALGFEGMATFVFYGFVGAFLLIPVSVILLAASKLRGHKT